MAWLLPRFIAGLVCMLGGAIFGMLAGSQRAVLIGALLAGLLGFAWLELIYHDHDNPSTLASLSLAYFALMLLGMALFGIELTLE